MRILIQNGHIIDPSQGINDVRDILIENGKIKDIITKSKEQRVQHQGLSLLSLALSSTLSALCLYISL